MVLFFSFVQPRRIDWLNFELRCYYVVGGACKNANIISFLSFLEKGGVFILEQIFVFDVVLDLPSATAISSV